jgi:hypothetical protein
MKRKEKIQTDPRVGDAVDLACYHEHCPGRVKGAVLGRGFIVHPAFAKMGRAGKITWTPSSMLEGFTLRERVTCPECKAVYGDAMVVIGLTDTVIFGYEPQPA